MAGLHKKLTVTGKFSNKDHRGTQKGTNGKKSVTVGAEIKKCCQQNCPEKKESNGDVCTAQILNRRDMFQGKKSPCKNKAACRYKPGLLLLCHFQIEPGCKKQDHDDSRIGIAAPEAGNRLKQGKHCIKRIPVKEKNGQYAKTGINFLLIALFPGGEKQGDHTDKGESPAEKCHTSVGTVGSDNIVGNNAGRISVESEIKKLCQVKTSAVGIAHCKNSGKKQAATAQHSADHSEDVTSKCAKAPAKGLLISGCIFRVYKTEFKKHPHTGKQTVDAAGIPVEKNGQCHRNGKLP